MRGRPLTSRELEVLGHVAAGLPSKQIAAVFGISGRTVDWHIANALRKLGARSRAQAVARATRLRLIHVDSHSRK